MKVRLSDGAYDGVTWPTRDDTLPPVLKLSKRAGGYGGGGYKWNFYRYTGRNDEETGFPLFEFYYGTEDDDDQGPNP